MEDDNPNELKTEYLHMNLAEFRLLLRSIGDNNNSASMAIGRNRHFLTQQTSLKPMIIEKYRKAIGDTLFFNGFATVLDKREQREELRQAKIREEAEELRIKAEKAAQRREKRLARLNRPEH